MVGSVGDIVFEVSDKRVRTFNDFKRDGQARFATHEVLGKKPVLEFIGPDIETISFSVRFDSFLGLEPTDEIQKLRGIRDKGEPVELILSGMPVSENLWVLDSLSEAHLHFDNNGRVLVAETEMSLKEYSRDPVPTATEGARDDGD